MSRLTRLALATAVAALTAASGAGAAHAGIAVSNANPGDGDPITATVSNPPTGANAYTIAQCNVTDADAADWGRDCNRSTASSFVPISDPDTDIDVFASFTNSSFVPGLSPQYGATTTCKGGVSDSQCAVVVSWYSYTPPNPPAGPIVIPIGNPEKANITF